MTFNNIFGQPFIYPNFFLEIFLPENLYPEYFVLKIFFPKPFIQIDIYSKVVMPNIGHSENFIRVESIRDFFSG